MREADKLLVKFAAVKNIDEAEDKIPDVSDSVKPKQQTFSLYEVEAKQRVRETKKALKQIAMERKAEQAKKPAVAESPSPRRNRAYAAKLKLPPPEKRNADSPRLVKTKEHPVTSLFRYYMTLDERQVKDPDVDRYSIIYERYFSTSNQDWKY